MFPLARLAAWAAWQDLVNDHAVRNYTDAMLYRATGLYFVPNGELDPQPPTPRKKKKTRR